MDLSTLLALLPGAYWNNHITWHILERDSTPIFEGKWEDAIKLEDETLNREVWSYSTKRDNNGTLTDKFVRLVDPDMEWIGYDDVKEP